jgi:hypothetical protein
VCFRRACPLSPSDRIGTGLKTIHWEQARIALALGDMRPFAQHLRTCRGYIHPMLASEIKAADFVLNDPALRGGAITKFQRDFGDVNERLIKGIKSVFDGNAGTDRCSLLADMCEGKWVKLRLDANAHRRSQGRRNNFDDFGQVRVAVFLERRLLSLLSQGKKQRRKQAINAAIARFGGSTSAVGKILDADRSRHGTMRGIGCGVYLDDQN